MTIGKTTPNPTILVAIDVSKARNDVLIEVPGAARQCRSDDRKERATDPARRYDAGNQILEARSGQLDRWQIVVAERLCVRQHGREVLSRRVDGASRQ